MIRTGEQRLHSPPRAVRPPVSPHEEWVARYGPLVAEQLRPERRYSLITVGAVQFAYTDYDGYLRALGQSWAAGFVPEPLPTTQGADLLAVAPDLRGVDVDLGGLTAADVAPPERRFTGRA